VSHVVNLQPPMPDVPAPRCSARDQVGSRGPPGVAPLWPDRRGHRGSDRAPRLSV